MVGFRARKEKGENMKENGLRRRQVNQRSDRVPIKKGSSKQAQRYFTEGRRKNIQQTKEVMR